MLQTPAFGAADNAVIVIYFLLILAIGVWSVYSSRRGTVSGYFLAGRFMTWLPVGASLFASNIGTEHFVGLTGSGAAGGISAGVFELIAIITIQMLGWIFLPVYIASGASTLPEYLGKRFGGQRIRLYLAILSLIMYILTKLSVDLFSSAVFIEIFLGWNIYYGIILVLAMTTLCTLFGGLTAVMYTETLQCALMVGGGLFVSIYSILYVGGYEGIMTKFWTAVPKDVIGTNLTCAIPTEKAFQMLRWAGDPAFPWPGFMFGHMIVAIWYWATDQLLVQRALAAKDISHAQGGTILTGYFKILPTFLMVLPGMASRILFPDEVACVTNCEAICGAKTCWNIAFPKLVMEIIPNGFRGLIFAVMIAALMGNISAVFNSSSTLFTMDIYSKIRRRASTRELLLVGRLSVIVLTVLSILWVPIIQRQQGGQLFLYMQSMFSYLAPPIAVSFILAVLWPRCNEPGVFYALVIGMVVGAIRMILDFVYEAPPCGQPDLRPAVIAKVHFSYFALMLSVLTATIAVTISLFTSAPKPDQLIRTTIWTCKDRTERSDDKNNLEIIREEPNMDNQQTKNLSMVEEPPASTAGGWFKKCFLFIGKRFCGDTNEQSNEFNEHLHRIQTLEQKRWQTVIIAINSVILTIVAIGLITFFSVWSPQIALRYKPQNVTILN